MCLTWETCVWLPGPPAMILGNVRMDPGTEVECGWIERPPPTPICLYIILSDSLASYSVHIF